MGDPCSGVPIERTSCSLFLPLPPLWIQAAWSSRRHRGAAARLCFQGSQGRVSTDLSLSLPWLIQDLRWEMAPELPRADDSGKDIWQHYFTPQASHHRPSYMTPRRPSGLGARTRLQGQKLSSSKSRLDYSVSVPAFSALPPQELGSFFKVLDQSSVPQTAPTSPVKMAANMAGALPPRVLSHSSDMQEVELDTVGGICVTARGRV
ncbi:hypothetical protein NDU88_012917 [Pleurodeles waltl]|uniref:Uncharacterized protein n=1 Tax=Pleurodeles waltl TaxID=8319 RepID=A0AAV7R774_PLEWA|nr:hypothetical protein NDU88_012917 [Pleurodeles waltl]